MTKHQIAISAVIAAPVDAVWAAYTNPDDITRWNFASPDWCCPTAEVDLREGGSYLARMEAKDGSFGFDLKATYREITPQKAFTLVLEDGRVVRTSFTAVDSQTRVDTIFDAETQNPISDQQDGWQAILDNFKAYVERK